MSNKIQIKRGVNASLPTLSAAEFGFSTDTHQVHIGDGVTNHEVVMHDLFTAQTVLAATTSGTPTALTVNEQTVIGRLTSGNVAAITLGIADNNIVQMDDADAADNDYAKFTTNGLEGRSYSEVIGDLSAQAGADFSMNTHKITSVTDPSSAQDAATKAYVDSVATGLSVHNACRVATNAVLPDCTVAGSGVGKTLTGNANAVLTVDGVATVLNDRILVKNQVAGDDNGIYKVTTEGTAGVPFVLTRATDFDTDAEVVAGAFMFVAEGTVGADHGFVLTTNDPITVDTTSMAFSIFSSAGEGISESLFDANTILKADSDDTPVALTVGASTFVGRKATGDISAMSVAEALTLLSVESGADVTDSTNVNTAGAVMEVDFNANTFLYATSDDTPAVKTRAEVMGLLSGQASAEFLMNTQKIGGVVDPTTAQQVSTKNYSDTRVINGGAF